MENKLSRWVKASKRKQIEQQPTASSCQFQENIRLVEGVFTPSEAADVLLSLVNDKIKFHTVQLLNLRDGYQEDTTHSEQRIDQLKLAKNRIKDLVIKARNEGYDIQIDGTIQITLNRQV